MNSSISPGFKGCRMSGLVGTGTVVWSGLYVIVSTVALVITVALLDIFYIIHNIYYWWYKGLLLIGCMVASVVIFWGRVIDLWYLWDRKTSLKEEPEDSTKKRYLDHMQRVGEVQILVSLCAVLLFSLVLLQNAEGRTCKEEAIRLFSISTTVLTSSSPQ